MPTEAPTPTLLQIVDEGDHGAAVDPERVAERLLGLPLGSGEVAGLAERRRDPVDRRAYTLYLTPTGRDLLADLERIVDEHDVELLTALNASQRSQLISLLQRVAESQGLAAGVHPELGREKATITPPRKTPTRSTRGPGEGPAEAPVWDIASPDGRVNAGGPCAPAGLSPGPRSGRPIQASAQCCSAGRAEAPTCVPRRESRASRGRWVASRISPHPCISPSPVRLPP